MIKTLIAEDNLAYCKNIINNVISQIDDIQINYIATKEEEIINFISKTHIDLILLDSETTKVSVIRIIKQLENLDIIEMPKIVIISKDPTIIENNSINNTTYTIMIKNEKTDKTYKNIKRIVDDINYKTNYSSIKSKVIDELIGMGYSLKYKGTIYIIEAIMYIYRY